MAQFLKNRIIPPMKAHIGSEKDLLRQHVLFEPKLDGIRAVCYVNKNMKFYSRNDIDITADYPELTCREAIKAKSAILDGEIVALDELLRPRFHLWQQGQQAVYIVFDILMLDGKLLLDVPLIERKKLLHKVLINGPCMEKIIYTYDGEALWHEMIKRDMEGVIAKEEMSLYYPGKRSKAWTKIKAFKALEAIIIGYIPGKRVIGALALGIYRGKKLTYIGNVGTGFTEACLNDIYKKLKKLEIKKAPIEEKIKDMIPVNPKLVCEIKYLEFTPAGILRAPVFLRLREDKDAKEITFKDQELKV